MTEEKKINLKDILIVDDERELVEQIETMLKKMGYSTDICFNHKQAISKLCQNNYKLIISDINLPDATGIEILKWSKQNTPTTRVILITGFLDEHDVHDALEQGCFGFLAKPITKRELKKIVKNALSGNPADKITDDQYARVDINDFICGKILNFPVYIRLGDSRFLKVAHSGTEIDMERVQTLKMKNINELWIDVEDLEDYVSLNEKLLLSKDKLNPAIKVRLLSHASELTYEAMRLFEIDEDTISTCMISMSNLITELEKNQDIYERVQEVFRTSPRISKMAILGASFSILVGKVMGWNSLKNLNTVAMGALFRDIYLIEKSFNYESLFSQTATYDKELYRSHPTEGAKLLSEFDFVPQDVLTIVEQHHEDGTNNGYPLGISMVNVFGSASLVNIVDYLLYKMFKFQQTHEKTDKGLAKYIEQALIARYGNTNPNVFAILAILRKPTLSLAQWEFEAIKKRGFLSF